MAVSETLNVSFLVQKIFKQVCKAEGLPEPVAEFKFHETRKWRIDWYFEFEGKKVALEVEGGVYKYGRHNRANGFLKDMEKYNQLAAHGILLVRCVPKDLLKISTINLIKQCLY
ncbi:MAG: hypothetical protein AAF806_18330 [Bacteroidota bacterium]